MIVDLILGVGVAGFILTMWAAAIYHVVIVEKIWRQR